MRPVVDDIHITPGLLLELKVVLLIKLPVVLGALLLILGQADEILREDDESPLYLGKGMCLQAVAFYYLKGLVCKIK